VDELLAWLYPNRVLVALVSIAIVAVLAIVGWRRGWHHAARRHPRVTAGAAAVALAVALPLGWYLGSPLFVRTALEEPAPVAATPGPTPAASPSADPVQTPSTETSAAPSASLPSESPPPTPAPPIEGRFRGADDFHFARGTARLVETAPGEWVLRIEEFSVRNGPDLYVYLSPDPDGYVRRALELGTLKATDGAFNYRIPRGTDVQAVRSVVIWCKAFSVQFGAARLSR
jgi:Electron transfer DM13